MIKFGLFKNFNEREGAGPDNKVLKVKAHLSFHYNFQKKVIIFSSRNLTIVLIKCDKTNML